MGTRRKFIVAGVAIGLLALPNPFAHADSGFALTRIAGDTRYATAKALALGFAATSDQAVIATGENFPDALAGSYLAGQLNAPILLTTPDELPAPTDEALTAMKVKTVTLIGGTSAISPAVEAGLKVKGYTVERIFGTSRYDTAKRVAEKSGAAAVGKTDGKPTAILGTAANFPDAVAVGPLAFAGKLPVLLTEKEALSPEADAAFKSLGIARVLLLGGTAAISSAVEGALTGEGIEVIRVAGANRSDTAAQLADFAVSKLSFSTATVNLARGDSFADALAGGPYGGRSHAATLLTASADDLGQATKGWLTAHQSTLKTGTIFGGLAAVSNAVKGQAEVAGGGQAVPASLTITDGPADNVPVKDTKPTFKGTAEAYQGAVSQVDVEVKGPHNTVLVTASCDACEGSTAAWAFAPQSDLEAGTYTLTFTATTDAGKTSKPVARTLVIDTTPPTLDDVQATVHSNVVTAVFTEPLDCKTVSRDDFSVRISGTASSPTDASCSESTVKLTSGGSGPAYKSTVSVSVIDAVNDLAGNEAPHTSKSTTTGEAPPTTTTTSTTLPEPPVEGPTTTVPGGARCTHEGGDAGILSGNNDTNAGLEDPVGQQLWDGVVFDTPLPTSLEALDSSTGGVLFEDPEADGTVSKAIRERGSGDSAIVDDTYSEAACDTDVLIDSSNATGADL
jgi:putative cell wall-binding protein